MRFILSTCEMLMIIPAAYCVITGQNEDATMYVAMAVYAHLLAKQWDKP